MDEAPALGLRSEVAGGCRQWSWRRQCTRRRWRRQQPRFEQVVPVRLRPAAAATASPPPALTATPPTRGWLWRGGLRRRRCSNPSMAGRGSVKGEPPFASGPSEEEARHLATATHATSALAAATTIAARASPRGPRVATSAAAITTAAATTALAASAAATTIAARTITWGARIATSAAAVATAAVTAFARSLFGRAWV